MLFITGGVTQISLLSFTNVIKGTYLINHAYPREHVKNLIWGTGKTKGTNQTIIVQACAMITRKFRDFE